VARILVIDDNALVRRQIVDILISAGHETFEADHGDKGLYLCRDRDPKVVITALVMPNKDGLEIITELRREAYRGPIIAISGGDASRRALYLRLAKMMGADESLAEPFSASELVETIDRLLGGGEQL
jgi:DNA-binding response OmpR family regulator